MPELRDRLQAALGPGYRVERELGGGGMSHVFLAEEIRLDRRVVVKVLPPEMSLGVSVDRFEREIQLAARLQHPHIVPLLTAGSSEDLLYYIMPFIEGESLRAKLAREGELPVPEALRILRDVVDALAFAHGQKVVHRDIKPDNVLLSGKHALVTDFGVAKAVAESTGRQTLTSMGVALGTPLYMAPEQATADPHVDHRADIYALGVLAYEMLCGRPPFTGMTAQAVLASHLTDAPEPVTKHRSAVPDALNAVILRCLEKKPADRWQQVEELLPHLEAMLTPTGGTTPTGLQPVISSGTQAAIARGHPLRVTGLFALASIGVLALVYALVRAIGLPDWVFLGAVALLVVGWPVALLTGHHEGRRALARATGIQAPPSGGVRAWLTWRRSLIAAGLGFASLGVVTAAYMAMRALGIGPAGTLVASGVLQQGGQIVLADFTDRTGDSALATTFTEAFRVDLNQSRTLRLMPAADLRRTLQLMRQDPRGALTPELAREVAVREGLKAVLAGEINAAGGGFVLTVELLEPESGNAIVAFRENARDSTEIIRAMDRLSKQLRRKAGESLKSVRASPPLSRFTTTSLPALRKYSQAQRLTDAGDQLGALRPLMEAVELDSTFAEAWRRGAVILGNLGIEPSSRRRAMTRAYRYSERLPEVERYMVRGSYFTDVTGDYRAAVDAYHGAVELDSTNGPALNNAALAHSLLREFDAAASLYRRAVALYPQQAMYINNLVVVHLERGALDDARATLEEFRRTLPDHPTRWAAELEVAWAGKLYDSVAAIARGAGDRYRDGVSQRRWLLSLFFVSALGGRRRAMDEYAQADSRWLDSLGGQREALRVRLRGALLDLRLGAEAGRVTAQAEQALRRSPLEPMDPVDRPYLDLAMVYLAAGDPARARTWIRAYEQNVPVESRGGRGGSELQYLAVSGWLALAENRAADAIRLFRESDRGACVRCGLPGLANAQDAAGAPDSALALYERYVNGVSDWPPTTDIFWLPSSLKRLGELYEARGDRAKAVEYYARFAELWRNADPELQPVVRDVRERIARLAGEGGPR